MTALIFIDTNILLDFYRAVSGDVSLDMLKHFDGNHQRIISTSEVEMEFKKNRQRVILDSLSSIKIDKSGQIQIPAFLRASKLSTSVKTTQ